MQYDQMWGDELVLNNYGAYVQENTEEFPLDHVEGRRYRADPRV